MADFPHRGDPQARWTQPLHQSAFHAPAHFPQHDSLGHRPDSQISELRLPPANAHPVSPWVPEGSGPRPNFHRGQDDPFSWRHQQPNMSGLPSHSGFQTLPEEYQHHPAARSGFDPYPGHPQLREPMDSIGRPRDRHMYQYAGESPRIASDISYAPLVGAAPRLSDCRRTQEQFHPVMVGQNDSRHPDMTQKRPHDASKLMVTSKRKKREAWSADEDARFREGLEIYGRGCWRSISTHVKTRTPTQIASHAQKHFLRLANQTSRNESESQSSSASGCVGEAQAGGGPRESPTPQNPPTPKKPDSEPPGPQAGPGPKVEPKADPPRSSSELEPSRRVAISRLLNSNEPSQEPTWP